MDRHGSVGLQTPTAIGSASAAIPTAAVGPAVVVPTASSAVTAARTEDRLGAGIVVVGARAGMGIAPTDPDAQHREERRHGRLGDGAGTPRSPVPMRLARAQLRGVDAVASGGYRVLVHDG